MFLCISLVLFVSVCFRFPKTWICNNFVEFELPLPFWMLSFLWSLTKVVFSESDYLCNLFFTRQGIWGFGKSCSSQTMVRALFSNLLAQLVVLLYVLSTDFLKLQRLVSQARNGNNFSSFRLWSKPLMYSKVLSFK